jgi:hypothetical protein
MPEDVDPDLPRNGRRSVVTDPGGKCPHQPNDRKVTGDDDPLYLRIVMEPPVRRRKRAAAPRMVRPDGIAGSIPAPTPRRAAVNAA